MKKLSLIICTLAVVLFSFSSCNNYRSIESASRLGQLRANPFMFKVAKSVMHGIKDNIIEKGLTSFKGKPLLGSRLTSLFNTVQSVSAFKGMLANTYGISKNKVEANYTKWNTVRDVIGFVARNGKRYNFNSYSNKLF